MRYDNTTIEKTDGVRRYKSTIYPLINPKDDDLYVVTVLGDRLDTLANDFYKDSSLWWIIASANNIPKDSVNVTPGTQIRIPANVNDFIKDFVAINKNR